jgi:anthranilate synthase component I
MAMVTKTLIRDDLTPVSAYAALRAAQRGPTFLLESVVNGERWGRYSILGYRPRHQIRIAADAGDPLLVLAQRTPAFVPQVFANVATRFAQSQVGVFMYDLVHSMASIPTPEPLGDVVRLLEQPTVVVFDHWQQSLHLAAHDEAGLEQVIADLEQSVPLRRLSPPKPMQMPAGLNISMDDSAFAAMVERTKEYIAAGDVFQTVLSRTFTVPAANKDPLDVYRALRVLSPSPYMYLVDFPEEKGGDAWTVVGASPETLVRMEQGQITLRPLAGTRRRGRSEAEDEAFAQEMLHDEKERAEHVMLIDLARNDVGRVAKVGSVYLPKIMEIDRFSHVMHMVSEVRGQVRDGVSPWDVIRATFPAGTLSGAPKVRAMQIIAEQERSARGVYGGAVGYVDGAGNIDLAIAIRTIIFRNNMAEVRAGAGIVEGSDPKLEVMETHNKAKAGLAALAAVE